MIQEFEIRSIFSNSLKLWRKYSGIEQKTEFARLVSRSNSDFIPSACRRVGKAILRNWNAGIFTNEKFPFQ